MKDYVTVLLAVLAAAVIVSVVVIFQLVIALQQSEVKIRNVGEIKAVGVKFYLDPGCLNEISFIDWGRRDPGDVFGVVVFCRNVMNTAVTLNLSTSNWNPLNASLFLHASWNITSDIVFQPEQVIPVEFQLTVDVNVTGFTHFSFDMIIGVTEH